MNDVNMFHDVNSTLQAVTGIDDMGGFLLTVFKVFYSMNLILSRNAKFSHKKEKEKKEWSREEIDW